jgi:hypothetical protein
MRTPLAAVVGAAVIVAVLSGCASGSDGVRIAGSPAPDRTPYTGVLTPPPSAAADRPGAAGDVVRCSTTPVGSTRSSPYTAGAVAATPERAIGTAWSEGLFLDLTTRSLARERTDGDRVLFTTAYRGVARQAVIVRHGPAGPGTGADADGLGWWVESWARCDLADFPESVSAAAGVQIWSDGAGRRVATARVLSSRGPEHCGWQDMTFLSLDGGMNGRTKGETYIDRPSADLAEYVDTEPEPHVALPAGAVDTGYHRGDRRLWLAPDHAVAYVGTEDDVAAWPRVTRPFGCA